MEITVLDHKFRLDRRGLRLPDNVPFEVWAEAYEAATQARDTFAWALADLIVYGVTHFPDDAYNVLGDVTKLSRGRLMNMKSVAEAVPRENREFDLSFSHYTEAAKIKDKDEQRRWLEWAVKVGASRDDMRTMLSGGNEPQIYLPPVRPSTPTSALYWIRDWLEGKRNMSRTEVLEIIREVIERYTRDEDEDE